MTSVLHIVSFMEMIDATFLMGYSAETPVVNV